MSFNRSRYSSLQDAFGIKTFTQEIKNNEYTIATPVEVEQVALPATYETFGDVEEEELSCEKVSKHCTTCGCQKPYMKNMFAEFLNFLLILILIWILVYKPRGV